jgi:hypothetical protein
MEITLSLKQSICALFEVHQDENGVQRVVTPLEYGTSGDRVVVRVRPTETGFSIDENGEAAMYAGFAGGDVESEAVDRWSEDLSTWSPVTFGEDEYLRAFAGDERLVTPYVFRVAEAAQQLHTIAVAKGDRKASDFKDRVAEIIQAITGSLGLSMESDVELPIVGGLRADHVIAAKKPLIIIAATSARRLLEAEVIYMQYRAESKPGVILAIAESQKAVGQRQFERANYYTDKTVVYSPDALRHLVSSAVAAH